MSLRVVGVALATVGLVLMLGVLIAVWYRRALGRPKSDDASTAWVASSVVTGMVAIPVANRLPAVFPALVGIQVACVGRAFWLKRRQQDGPEARDPPSDA